MARRQKPRRENPAITAAKIAAIGAVIVALIGLVGLFLNPQLLSRFEDWLKPTCPYQGSSDMLTLTNLINAEAEADNAKDYALIQKIFDPNARIRNRVNDQNASEKKQEWISPKVYYADTLYPTTTFTSAIHSTITPVGPGIALAEAWLTSASSGYANGVKYDNPPGSDQWRFIKNKEGCWVIAEFDFNASHISFP